MRPGADSLPWEGLQGTDSFFPWPVGGRWRALYGSAWTETKPIGHWLVGPAEAPSLAGPWRRVREDNPAPIEKRFIENPIVTEAPGGGCLAVYDSESADAIGWAYSADGIRWGQGQRLVVQPKAGEWCEGGAHAARPRARGRRTLHALLHRLRSRRRTGCACSTRPAAAERPARWASSSCVSSGSYALRYFARNAFVRAQASSAASLR